MLLLHLIAGLFLAQPDPAAAPWTLAPAATEVHAHALPGAGMAAGPGTQAVGSRTGGPIGVQHVVAGGSSAFTRTTRNARLHPRRATGSAADLRTQGHDSYCGSPLHGGRTPGSYGNPPPPPLTA